MLTKCVQEYAHLHPRPWMCSSLLPLHGKQRQICHIYNENSHACKFADMKIIFQWIILVNQVRQVENGSLCFAHVTVTMKGSFPCQLIMNKGFSFYRESGATLERKSNTKIWCQTSSEAYNNIGVKIQQQQILVIY